MSEVSAYHPLEQGNVFERPPSTKAAARAARRADRNAKQQKQATKPLEAKTETQRDYLEVLRGGESAFAIGPAGTGKTYLAARIMAQRLIKGEIERIIVARVTVSKAKHALGFLPGNLDAKMKPWLIPVIEGIRAEVSAAQLDAWKAEGKLEFASFEHMRGRSFHNAGILLDEAQNADFGDLSLFLTRIGENSQAIVTGDLDQVDVPNGGLEEILDLCETHDIPMDIIEFHEEDVVRSQFAKAWVKALAARKRQRACQSDGGNLDRTPRFLQS